jgi:hypothetical protein
LLHTGFGKIAQNNGHLWKIYNLRMQLNFSVKVGEKELKYQRIIAQKKAARIYVGEIDYRSTTMRATAD